MITIIPKVRRRALLVALPPLPDHDLIPWAEAVVGSGKGRDR
jgi:hypothetical protein